MGLHVVCPIKRKAGFHQTRKFAADIARYLAFEKPDTLTTEQRKKRRKGRLFLDTVRNSYGHTLVAPYSLRPLPGAPVATPVSWAEVGKKSLTPDRYSLANIFRRLGTVSTAITRPAPTRRDPAITMRTIPSC